MAIQVRALAAPCDSERCDLLLQQVFRCGGASYVAIKKANAVSNLPSKPIISARRRNYAGQVASIITKQTHRFSLPPAKAKLTIMGPTAREVDTLLEGELEQCYV